MEDPAPRKAVVLLSGGLDSATALAVARDEGFDCHPLSFRYGQRHEQEVDAAVRIAESQGVRPPFVVEIDLRRFGASALTGDIDVPRDRPDAEMASGIPVTYVPARNTIFLSFALAWAEVLGASDIFIGINARDYSGYPDCRPEYLRAFQNMANLATRAAVEGSGARIRAPLIELTKAEIIRKGRALGVDYSLTRSCYDPAPDGRACGHCASCRLRMKGFREAGVADPTRYARNNAGGGS